MCIRKYCMFSYEVRLIHLSLVLSRLIPVQLLHLMSEMMTCFVTPGQDGCWDVKSWLE